MTVDWELTPRMLLSQLSAPEREQVSRAIAHLQEDFDHHTPPSDVQRLRVVPGSSRELYVLKSGLFRIIFAHEADTIAIVDLFPTSQIEKLRLAQRSH